MRKIALLLMALGLQACAGMRWTKSGAGAEEADRDLQACRQIAAERSARSGAVGLPSPAFDPRFGAPPGPTQMDLRMQERQLEERCMRDKGYAPVPVDK